MFDENAPTGGSAAFDMSELESASPNEHRCRTPDCEHRERSNERFESFTGELLHVPFDFEQNFDGGFSLDLRPPRGPSPEPRWDA
jgi:hypothetical protein